MPYELTLEIALMLGYPAVGKSNFEPWPALHKFRLVCRTFGSVGKQAIILIATDPATSPYKTLSVPPDRGYNRIIRMINADKGALAKLVTAVSVLLVPTDVSGPFNRVQGVFCNVYKQLPETI